MTLGTPGADRPQQARDGSRFGLAARFGRGYRLDSAELTDLFDLHSAQLLSYLGRQTLDHQVALDLLAETFAQAFLDRTQFRGRTRQEALGWLFGIARHQVASYYRRGQAETRALRRLGAQTPQWEDAEYERVEELHATASLRKMVRRKMLELPPDQQAAVALRVIDEVPYQEIAAELGISEQTVRARVSRALRKLADEVRAQLDQEAVGHER